MIRRKILPKLASIVLTASVFLIGCGKELTEEERAKLEKANKPITAEVLEERYSGRGFIKVNEKHIRGLVSQAYSNETSTIGNSVYTLKINTDDGQLKILNIINSNDVNKEALEHIIEKGNRIQFRQGNIYVSTYWLGGAKYEDLITDHKVTYFKPGTQIGTKYAKEIYTIPDNSK